MSNCSHTFAEEREPGGRLILTPCLSCGMTAMDAMEAAKAEIDHLQAERPSSENCGREERCDWKKTSVEGHKAAISRSEKAEAEVERLRALCAERPKINIPWTMNAISEHNKAYVEWAVKIDAAGRGEG